MRARELRHAQQVALARSGGGVVVTLNLNLPGGTSSYQWSQALLREGQEAIEAAHSARSWRVVVSRTERDAAGIHWVGVVSVPAIDGTKAALRVKGAMCSIEEGHPLGRLLDIDVLDGDGVPVSRSALGVPPRRCLVCPEPAHECRVTCRHDAITLRKAAERVWCRKGVELVTSGALAGMLLEATTWPSPGLVNPYNQGSHTDMNYLSFLLSASALTTGFRDMAQLGVDFALERRELWQLPSLLDLIRSRGLLMERSMYRATGGTNTHRGLIFVLGLASAAAGYVWTVRATELGQVNVPSEHVAQVVAKIAHGLVDRELRSPDAGAELSRGQLLFRATGLQGVRGEMERGLPSVINVGLPAFIEALGRVGLGDALVHCLISIMSVAEDSALAGRHSAAVLREVVWSAAREVLEAGSVFTRAGRAKILEMDRMFREANLNPGGSADLLALTVAMYMWEHGCFDLDSILRNNRSLWTE